jgi:hypothetical protein
MINSTLVTEGGDTRWKNGSHDAVAYCPQAQGSLTYDFMRYRVEHTGLTYHLVVDDLLNSISSMLYLDITPQVSGTNPLFYSGYYNFGAYLYPYETIYNQAYKLHKNSASALFKPNCPAFGGSAFIPSISSAEIDTTAMPPGFVPQLILQDVGVYFNAISVPLLKHRDLSPLLSDTWAIKINVIHSFRGIYPKAIKYFRWPEGK